MSDISEPTKEQPKYDEEVLKLARTIGMVLGDEAEAKVAEPGAAEAAPPPEPAAPETPSATPPKEEAAKESQEGEGEKSGGSEAPSGPAQVVPKEYLDRLNEADLNPIMPRQAEVKKKNQPTKEQVELLARLSAADREEYELASFAEARDPDQHSGKSSKILEYFEKRQKYQMENPEATVGSEALSEFEARELPEWEPSDKRRWERELIKELTRDQVMREANERLRQVEIKPKVEAECREFGEQILNAKTLDNKDRLLPEEAVPLVQKFLQKPTKEALGELKWHFPAEAVPVVEAVQTVEAYTRIVNGVDRFNPQPGTTHARLAAFMEGQAAIRKRQPAKFQTDEQGRKFVSVLEYAELTRVNPDEARKCFTFSDQEIKDMILVNAARNVALNRQQILQYSERITKGKNPIPANPPKEPAATNGENSPTPPRASSSKSPGATIPAAKVSVENMADLKRLFPNAEKILAGK